MQLNWTTLYQRYSPEMNKEREVGMPFIACLYTRTQGRNQGG